MSDWLTLSQTGGTGDTQITITASTSEELYSRIARFRARTPNNLTADFAVNQYGTASFFFRGYYYVEDLSADNAPIFYNSYSTGQLPSGLYQMSVDGGPFVPANSAYTFSETGWHIIDYTLTGTTEIPAYMFSKSNQGSQYQNQVRILYGVDIGDLVTGVGKFAFDRQDKLTGVTWGSNLEYIRDGAFSGCDIQTAVLPESVNYIGDGAFAANRNLYYVTLPSNLQVLGDTTYISNLGVFEDCESLESIVIPSTIDYFAHSIFDGCTSLSSVTCGVITNIRSSAFRNTQLTQIPSIGTVERLGMAAFEGTQIATLTIPQNILEIGDACFSGCSNLTSVSFAQDSPILELGALLFQDCSTLGSITLPPNLINIGERCFKGDTALGSITIPSSVVEIGDGAFEDSGIYTLTMPPKCTRVPEKMCSHLTNVPGGNNLSTIVLHDNIYRVEAGVVGDLAQNITYTVPSNVEYIAPNNGSSTVFGYHQIDTLYFYPTEPPENFPVGDITQPYPGSSFVGSNNFFKMCNTGATIHYVSSAYNALNIKTLEDSGLYTCVGDLSAPTPQQPTTSMTVTYEITRAGNNTILNALDYRIRKIKLVGTNDWIDPVTTYNFSITGTYVFDIYLVGGVVPDNVFNNNAILKEVDLNSTELRIVGNYAGSGLRQITLPNVLCRTSNQASLVCGSLERIVNSDKLFVALNLKGASSLTAFTFGSYCINRPSFEDCYALTHVVWTSTLDTFTLRATFLRCVALSSVTINSFTKFMSYGVFGNTNMLTSVTIPIWVVVITEIFDGYDAPNYTTWPRVGVSTVYAYPERIPYGDLTAAGHSAKTGGTLHYQAGSDYSRWTSAYDFTYYGWTGVADL